MASAVLGLFALLYGGNQEMFDIDRSHYLKSDSGEVILKLRKADFVFDCNYCHKDFPTRTEPRELFTEHALLSYTHVREGKWCFFCHYEDLEKRNRIKLPDKGLYKGPDDMVRLCEQCHGDKTREWKQGIHGKVTGTWRTYGDIKQVRNTCGDCHSPHHPRSIKVKPYAAPTVRTQAGEHH